jgi:hypothetical protein
VEKLTKLTLEDIELEKRIKNIMGNSELTSFWSSSKARKTTQSLPRTLRMRRNGASTN